MLFLCEGSANRYSARPPESTPESRLRAPINASMPTAGPSYFLSVQRTPGRAALLAGTGRTTHCWQQRPPQDSECLEVPENRVSYRQSAPRRHRPHAPSILAPPPGHANGSVGTDGSGHPLAWGPRKEFLKSLLDVQPASRPKGGHFPAGSIVGTGELFRFGARRSDRSSRDGAAKGSVRRRPRRKPSESRWLAAAQHYGMEQCFRESVAAPALLY
jgi:hypothetical protein